MLASLMAAGTGINLTSANHCFIADREWVAIVMGCISLPVAVAVDVCVMFVPFVLAPVYTCLGVCV